MLNDFSEYIAKNNLFQKENKILLTVSGGIDSVVLSHLFYVAQFNFAIAHCNFGLRADESDGDEIFVQNLANQYQVPFFTKRFDTSVYAQQQQVSIQMAARELRYTWFQEIMEEHHFDYIATAHHQNDTIETILFNLVKGTGIAGLHGIQPKKGHIIRPLLFATREMIEQYAHANQLPWREDSSNSSNKYARNLIRNQVVPLLKKINPNLEDTLQDTIEKLQGVENVFEQQIQTLKFKALKKEKENYIINIEFLPTDSSLIILLFELLKPFGFNFSQAKQIADSLDKQAGKQFFSNSHILVKDRTQLVISPVSKNISETYQLDLEQNALQNEFLNLEWEIKTIDADFKIPKAANTACLDMEKIKFPLYVRMWKDGDWFCPLGMKGKKKISDFLINQKVPLNLKNRVFVVTSQEDIVWVVNHRPDNRFKIMSDTKKVLIITSYENQ